MPQSADTNVPDRQLRVGDYTQHKGRITAREFYKRSG